MPGYRRVIVKLSGEALSGPEAFGIHQPTIDRFAADIVAARSLGVTIGVVVGGEADDLATPGGRSGPAGGWALAE